MHCQPFDYSHSFAYNDLLQNIAYHHLHLLLLYIYSADLYQDYLHFGLLPDYYTYLLTTVDLEFSAIANSVTICAF